MKKKTGILLLPVLFCIALTACKNNNNQPSGADTANTVTPMPGTDTATTMTPPDTMRSDSSRMRQP